MFKIHRLMTVGALLALSPIAAPTLAGEQEEDARQNEQKAEQNDNGDQQAEAEQSAQDNQPAPPLESEKQKRSYSVGVSIAQNIKRNGMDVDPELVAAGLRAVLLDEEPRLSQQQARAALMKFQRQQQQEQQAQQQPQNNQPSNASPGESLRNAALQGNMEGVRQALDNGADANDTGQQGQTALMLAAYNGHSEIVELLLNKGAKVRAVDANDRNALMYASTGSFPETVKLLLEHDPMLDRTDNGEGFTALMFAAAEGNTEVARLLLEAGADPTIKDADEDTALDFAKQNGHSDAVELIEKHMDGQ